MTFNANVTPPAAEAGSTEQGNIFSRVRAWVASESRRLLAWVLSAVLALATSIFILQVVVVAIWPNNGAIRLDSQVQISFLNINLLALLMIPMTLFFVIWVDYFLHTKILND